MALLVGELFARITSDSSQFKRDMDEVDRKGASSAKAAEANALKIAAARKAEMDAAGKARVAQAALDELREKGNVKASKLAGAEERLAAANRDLAGAQAKTASLLRDESSGHEKAAAAAIKHSASLKGVLVGLGALPAGAAAAGVGIGAVLGGIPLLAAGAAAALLASNETVSTSYSNLWTDVRETARGFAEESISDYVQIAEQARGQFGMLKPDLQQLFATGSKYAVEFADSLGDLTRLAIPGVMRAIQQGQPVMDGWSKFLTQTGLGVGTFFDEVSNGSESAGQNLDTFGSVTNRTLGFLGSLVAKLSNEGVGSFRQFDETLGSTYDTVSRMADTGLPILGGATEGVLSAVNGLLTVAKPLDGVLGGLGGTVLAGAGAYRLFGAATNGLGDRLADMGTKVSGLGGATDDTAGKTSKWASATEKAGGALTKLGAAMPYIGIGAVALGLAVDAMGQGMEEATARGEALGEGLAKGGSDADRSRKRIADLTSANVGYQKSLNSLVEQQKTAGTAAGTYSASINDLHAKIDENNGEIAKATKKYEDIKSSLTGAELAQVKYNDAVQQHGPKSNEALAAGAAWRAELDLQSESTANATNALMGYIERLAAAGQAANDRAAAQLALRSSALELESAQKNLNDVTTKYGADSLQAREATVALEAAQMNRINTARNDAAASSLATNEQSKLNAANAAGNAAILNLVATSNGQWSPTLQTMIGTLSATELASIGVTRSVNETGQAVYRLPDGKTIVVNAETQAAKDRLAEIEKWQISDKFFTVTMRQQVDVIGTPIAGSNRSGADGSQWGGGGFNKGGWIGGKQYTGTGFGEDDTTIGATKGEFMVTRPAAARYGPFLEAINRGAGGEIKMPAIAVPQIPVPAAATATLRATTPAPAVVSGGTTVNKHYEIHMHAIKSLPTPQQVRDLLHDVEVQYG